MGGISIRDKRSISIRIEYPESMKEIQSAQLKLAQTVFEMCFENLSKGRMDELTAILLNDPEHEKRSNL